MIEFRKLWANARYEIITLLRGWFFRIFAGLSILILVTINIIFFSGVTPFIPRVFAGFSAAIPYLNMILLNMAQIAVIIFLASDFFKRDRKFNTAEVFYIRSMSNANYLLGKALGVFILFFSLTIIVLIVAVTIHLAFNENSFNWIPYLLYPVLLGLPSFIFIIGISFLFMQLIKNQAIVVLALLGYYAATLFYLYDKWYFIFDFIGFKIPFAYSDFVGFANFKLLLFQRGLYFSLGVLFILISILLFKRLAQSVIIQRIIIFGFVLFSAISFYCAMNYLEFYSDRHQLRDQMTDLNNRYVGEPELDALFCTIDFYHQGKSYQATTSYIIKNTTESTVDHYLFSINPGLKVEEVKSGSLSLEFTQEEHIIRIKPQNPLNPGLIDSLLFRFSGQIEEAACYLDIDEFEEVNSFSIWLYQSARKQVFLENDYVLLPPGSMWFPRPGLPKGTNFLHRTNRQFVTYRLEVHSNSDLTVLSQGTEQDIESGHVRFSSDVPISDISLIIGRYDKKSVRVDSIDYQLYHLTEHNYYEQYFSQISDTLTDVIREFVQDYEVRLNLDYPFKRLSLIEVPLQYYVYPRIWTITQDVVVPEQIWFQENAASLADADFNQIKRSMDRRLDHSNQTLTEKETEITILKTFFSSTFGGELSLRRGGGRRFGGGGGGTNVDYQPNYNLFPNFYSYVTNLKGNNWSILNTALEAFLYDRVQESVEEDLPMWASGGLTVPEEVSQALSKKSLAEYLTTMENKEILPEMIKQKGAFLIKLLQLELGKKEFDQYLSTTIKNSEFKQLEFNDFFGGMSLPPELDIELYLNSWIHDKLLPAYIIRDIEFYKVYDGDRIRTQVKFKTFNMDSTDGLLEVSFEYNRRGMGFDMGPQNVGLESTLFQLNGNQGKQFGILLDDEPRVLNVNFLLARNLPLIYTIRFEKAELEENKLPFEGEQLITQKAILTSPYETIVDNDDDGFEIVNPPFNSVIKRWIQGEEEENSDPQYEAFWWFNPPFQWRPIKNASYYGTFVHSAYYIRPGVGSKYVSWNAQIKTPGVYDVYTYMFNTEEFQRRRRGRNNMMLGSFVYKVYYEGGMEEVELSVDGAPPGWNFLGSWFFSEGEAKVVLTDETSARFVLADAVKWVKN